MEWGSSTTSAHLQNLPNNANNLVQQIHSPSINLNSINETDGKTKIFFQRENECFIYLESARDSGVLGDQKRNRISVMYHWHPRIRKANYGFVRNPLIFFYFGCCLKLLVPFAISLPFVKQTERHDGVGFINNFGPFTKFAK